MDDRSASRLDELEALVADHRAWLTERIVAAARAHGFDVQGPRLEAAWAASVCGFQEPLRLALAQPALSVRLEAVTDYAHHPLTAFGIDIARRHRGRGVSLARFLGLFKHYRRAHVALLERVEVDAARRDRWHDFLDSVFDLVEIGVVTEWAALDRDGRLAELETANRRATAQRLQYLSIFDSLPIPAILLDSADRVENANTAARRIFGDCGAPGGGYYGEAVPSALPSQLPELLAAAADARTTRLVTAGGERHFRVTSHRLLDHGDSATGRVVLLADVSDYVEELAAKTLADRAKSAFIASTSHDLRAPLSGILAAVELLEREGGGATTAPVATIRGATQVLLALVDDVLDHGRQEAAPARRHKGPLAVADALRAATETVRPRLASKAVGLELDLQLPAGLVLDIDGSKLLRIVVNLLDNAAKFTDRGEVVCRADWAAAHGELRVTVTDTGRGFPEAEAERLFAPFVRQASAEPGVGNGLGLAICRHLADALGGRITVRSRPGEGSRFTLIVPAGEAVAQPHVEPRRRARLLLVEDDDASRTATRGLLEHAGFAVIDAATAQAARRALLVESVAAAILDLRLPDGDGITLTGELRRQVAALPVVVLTADASEAVDAACRRAGVGAVLRKPTDLSTLVATLNELLDDVPRASPPVVDRDRLGGHLAVLGLGTVRVIVTAFDRSLAETTATLARTHREADLPALAERLHALAGAAAQLGLAALSARCVALDVVARAGDLDTVRGARDAFVEETRKARTALGRDLDGLLRDHDDPHDA